MLHNPRFIRRDWLAQDLAATLRAPGKAFVLLVAEPGAGKSAFLAQLALDNPDWLRYFIRRDQHRVLADVSDKSLLLRIGYQLSARHPELFSPDQLKVSIEQRIGQLDGEAVGAEVRRLTISPFYRKVLDIQQHVQANRGKVVGLRVDDLVIEERLLNVEDLLQLALVHPARALQRIDPTRQIVILVDALDEIRYHTTAENIVSWLANCPELPANIRFVLSSRPPDEALSIFRDKQAGRISTLSIDEQDSRVADDVSVFVKRLLAEPEMRQALAAAQSRSDLFGDRLREKAHGNLGYVDAIARGIKSALARRDPAAIEALIRLDILPADLQDLYAFFLKQIRNAVTRERIEVADAETGETYDKPVWPALYEPILGVLAVATRPVDLELLERLGGIRAGREWVLNALDRLTQFLDVGEGTFRFYHASVAEFLSSDSSLTDARRWHRRIADLYWAQRGNWSGVDTYGIESLAIHLLKCEDSQRLMQLVEVEWMHARVRAQAGSYRGFFADLSAVEQEILRLARASDCPPMLLAWAEKVSLVRRSINSVSGAYPPLLVAEAVKRGLWTLERALTIAEQVPDKESCAYTYIALLRAGVLPGAVRQRAIDAALGAALQILTDYKQGHAIVRLAPFLDDAALLDRAWLAAKKIRSKWREVRCAAMAALAVRITANRQQALKAALEDTLRADERSGRVRALSILAPYLTGHLRTRALNDDDLLAEVLEAIRPHLSQAMAVRLVPRVRAARELETRIDGFAALAPLLPADELREVSVQTLSALKRRKDKYGYSDLLVTTARWIHESFLDRLLSLVLSLTDADDRAAALAALAARLKGSQRTRAVGMVLRLATPKDDEPNLHRIEELMPLLNSRQRQALYRRAQTLRNQWRREGLLELLLPWLSEPQAGEILRKLRKPDVEEFAPRIDTLSKQIRDAWLPALYRAALDTHNAEDQSDLLLPLMPWISDEMIEGSLRAALSVATEVDDDDDPDDADDTDVADDPGVDDDSGDPDDIASVHIESPQAEPETAAPSREDLHAELDAMQRRHITDWRSMNGRLKELAPFLDGDLRHQAIDIGIALTQEAFGAQGLIAFSADFSEVQVARVLEVATEDPHPSDDMITSHSSRERGVQQAQAELVAAIASKLSSTQRERALRASAKWFGRDKVIALTGLAPFLAEPERSKAIDDALEASTRGPDDEERVFAALGPFLDRTRWARAIDAAESGFSGMSRAQALCGLLPFLSEEPTIVPRIRRAFVDHVLGEYYAIDGDWLGMALKNNDEARPILDEESLRAIGEVQLDVGKRWTWL